MDDGGNVVEGGTSHLTNEQVQAILDLKLQRLTALERNKISNEIKDLVGKITDLLDILGSKIRIAEIIKQEMLQIKSEFASPRKTTLEENEQDIDIEDLIQKEDMVVTVSHTGYIKRVPLSSYRTQKRGGKGKVGMTTKDEDFVHDLFVANTHASVLFFSTSGIVY